MRMIERLENCVSNKDLCQALDINKRPCLPCGNQKNILCENYADFNIYNADKTRLFFCLILDKTLHLKGCHEDKLPKERLTIHVASNMTVLISTRKLFVIGKSKTLRCFKNANNLLVDYRCN